MGVAVAPTDPFADLPSAPPGPFDDLPALAHAQASLPARILTGTQSTVANTVKGLGQTIGEIPHGITSLLEPPTPDKDISLEHDAGYPHFGGKPPAPDPTMTKVHNAIQPYADAFADITEYPTNKAAAFMAPSQERFSQLSPLTQKITTVGGQVLGQLIGAHMLGAFADLPEAKVPEETPALAATAGKTESATNVAQAASPIPETRAVGSVAPRAGVVPLRPQGGTELHGVLPPRGDMPGGGDVHGGTSTEESGSETPSETALPLGGRVRGGSPAEVSQGPAAQEPVAPKLGARDASGKLRANLSKVSTEDLAREFQALQDAQSQDLSGAPRYGVDPDALDPDVVRELGTGAAREFADHEMPNAELSQFGSATFKARAQSIARVKVELDARAAAGEDVGGILARIGKEGQPEPAPTAEDEEARLEREGMQGDWRTANPRLDKFDIDPSGRTEFAAEVQRLKESAGLQVPVQSFAEQRAQAMAFADEVGLSRLALDNAKVKNLSGAEIVGLKNVVSRNTDQIARLSKTLMNPELDPKWRSIIEEQVDQLHTQREGLLSNIVTAQAQAGRNLGFLRQLSTRSLDPDVWEIQARKVADRPLTDVETADIRRLVQETADACAGVPF